VLLNFRKHLRAAPGVDPRSSGAWFDGWSHRLPRTTQSCPIATARTWLATVGWRRSGGPISIHEAPASTGPRDPRRSPRPAKRRRG
jgi:hypothetical protein